MQEEFGSEDEATALVHRGARFLQAHGVQAFLDEVNKRDQGHLIDRDLYLGVYSMAQICKAHGINPRLVDEDVTDFQDLDGRRFVIDIVAIARRDGAGHFTYRWEHPLTCQPMTKSTHFERHGDLVLSWRAFLNVPARPRAWWPGGAGRRERAYAAHPALMSRRMLPISS